MNTSTRIAAAALCLGALCIHEPRAAKAHPAPVHREADCVGAGLADTLVAMASNAAGPGFVRTPAFGSP